MTHEDRIEKLKAAVKSFVAGRHAFGEALMAAEAAGEPDLPDGWQSRWAQELNDMEDAIHAEAAALDANGEAFMVPFHELVDLGNEIEAEIRAVPPGVPFKIVNGKPVVVN
jgi:hypothetical protein